VFTKKPVPGLIYWHPKGARIRVEIENFWRKAHLENGYELLYSPHMGKSWLWETSGHLGFIKKVCIPNEN
jgi:threonyl-tRNA synthetase